METALIGANLSMFIVVIRAPKQLDDPYAYITDSIAQPAPAEHHLLVKGGD